MRTQFIGINKIQYIINKSNMAAITMIKTRNIQNPLSGKLEKNFLPQTFYRLVKYLKIRHENTIYRD